jgi:phytoene/squalene synthetase
MRDPLLPLCDTGTVAGEEALARCARAVVALGPVGRIALALAPPASRGEVAALVAWLLLVELAEDDEALRGRLARELAGVESGRAGSALAAALVPACARRGVEPRVLREGLALLDRAERGHATREELVGLARRRAAAAVRVATAVLGLENERDRTRAEALGIGLRLSAWARNAGREWRAGRLVLPSEDLARCGVSIGDVDAGRRSVGLRVLLAELADAARGWLDKGWPVAAELGPLRGRALALVLRWNAAALSAVATGAGDASLGRGVRPRPARWPWILVALVSPAPVRQSSALPPPPSRASRVSRTSSGSSESR